MTSFPERIATDRLLLRCWRPEDAPLLKATVDANLAHLQQWMPWAMEEPSPLEVVTAKLTKFAENFHAGTEWIYAIFTPDEQRVLGGTGLHLRQAPGVIEIGYWIDQEHTRRGLATEVTRTLTAIAFTDPGTEVVEVRCNPLNTASARVPERLGFTLREVLRNDGLTPQGEPRDTMVWEMRRGPPECFELAELRLRRPRPSDAEAILEYANDPEVARYADWPVGATLDRIFHTIDARAERWERGEEFYWVIAERESDRAIGGISCRMEGDAAEIGFLVHRQQWGRGLATAACVAVADWALSLPTPHRLWATCDVDNHASARVLEKAGFTLEDRLVRYAVRPNISDELRDALRYSRRSPDVPSDIPLMGLAPGAPDDPDQ
ncbi:MAG: GNAT family N-acetyltransferase [Gemmatimonadales bacterium]|nr:GNAT family N-acetyltransferase [Gemmatimonadales bacterium]MBP6572663.1 GNAT family N-acetyltransferase [Gemmatimonadales bacterium]MBP7621829.1 GNAT family N-acetyltransferase [Gemmatimonadales bacterium]